MSDLGTLKFNWDASLNLEAADSKSEPGSLIISGELVNASVCANNFAIDELELPKLVAQLKDATLRVDHSKSVRDVIGGFRGGKYDEKGKRVMFEAEVDEPWMQKLIIKGRVKHISIGASADAFCSVCEKPTKPLKTCKCKGSHDVIKNIKLREGSIITEPAYTSSEFRPVSFVASIENALEAEKVTLSSKEEARPSIENKNMEERVMSIDKKEVEATTLKPAGADAVVVLGEQVTALAAQIAKFEERFKKADEDEAKKKAKDDECKKEEAFITVLKEQFASLTSKFDEAFKPKKDEGIPKTVGKKEPPEEEEDKKPVEKTKKDVVVKGAKIESATETQVEITGDNIPAWFKEVIAEAKKKGILD